MRSLTVLGPAGAGKTELLAHLAALEGGELRSETRSGCLIVEFDFMGERWCAFEVPGDVEHLPEARAALLAGDVAVVVVPPDPDSAVLAAPFLRLVEEAEAPCLLFINRIDQARGRMRDLVAALQEYTHRPIVLRQVPIREGGRAIGAVDLVSERAWRYNEGGPSALIEIPEAVRAREREAREELLEQLAEHDDALLEDIVEDREPAVGALYALCARVLGEDRITEALVGSALKGAGVRRLMKALRHEAPPPLVLRGRLAAQAGESEPLAVAFLSEHRRHVGKITFLRALGPDVAPGAPLGGGDLGTLTAISGDAPAPAPLPEGAVAAARKSDQLYAPALLHAGELGSAPAWARAPEPMFACRLVAEAERDEAKLSVALARLAEDDPGLVVSQDETSGAHGIRFQGPLHLRRVLRDLAEVHGVTAVDQPAVSVWKETISRASSVHHRHRKQTGGAGQYADVKLSVRPAPRGAGFIFEDTVKGGAIPRNYIPAVEAGARDALAEGPLGFGVVDVAVTLTDGRSHAVDSSDFAFRTAGRVAVAQALGEAAPVLLQPIHAVTIRAPSTHSGALVALVSSLRGRVLGFDRDPEARGWDLFLAQLPAETLEDLARSLRSATQGVGWFEHAFDHFEEVHGKEADRVLTMRV